MSSEKKNFLVLIMGLGDGVNSMPEEEMNAHMAKWFAWDAELTEKGYKISGEALMPTGKIISGKEMNVTDGVVAAEHPMMAVGGYYLLSCANMDEAVEVSKGCPTYELDGVVEVREVMVMEQ